jgi:hypothetical protein
VSPLRLFSVFVLLIFFSFLCFYCVSTLSSSCVNIAKSILDCPFGVLSRLFRPK